jgi:hypothetical protein
VRRLAAPVVVVLAGASLAVAAELPLRLSAVPDPLRAGSLPFEPVTAALLTAGEWRAQMAATYANLWQGTWQTAAIHEELGRYRQPIGDDELRELERRYPGEEMYRVDLEAWRADLMLQGGLGRGIVLTVQIPWIDVGGPHWDGVAEWWHAHLGMPSADRELFPRSQTFLWATGRNGTIEQRQQLAVSGIGDVDVSLGVPLGELAGASHRLVVALEAPTGDAGTLLGSGGWDLGLRWFATWSWNASTLLAGLGYTRLDPDGSLLGIRRADTWHSYAGFTQDLGKGWNGDVAFSYESSPLAEFTHSALGKPAAYLRLGVARGLGGASWIAFDMGQDWYNVGLSPDYAFRLSFGTGGRRPPQG